MLGSRNLTPALLAALATAAPTPTGTPVPRDGRTLAGFDAARDVPVPAAVPAAEPLMAARSEILAQVNLARAGRNTPALRLDGALNRAAQERAEAIASAPAPAEGSHDVGGRVDAAGYGHKLVSETVLRGDGSMSGRLEALRRVEPEVYDEVLSPTYRDLGVGLADGDEGLVRVLILGRSLAEDFRQKTAALADLAALRAQLLTRVNAERKAHRLQPLRESPVLDRVAQAHAEDMIRRSFYGHETPEGIDAMTRAARAGYAAAAIGENIAQGQCSVAEAVDGWMASPTHREHILSLVLKQTGIGMAFGKNAHGYQIVWVQVFGTPLQGP